MAINNNTTPATTPAANTTAELWFGLEAEEAIAKAEAKKAKLLGRIKTLALVALVALALPGGKVTYDSSVVLGAQAYAWGKTQVQQAEAWVHTQDGILHTKAQKVRVHLGAIRRIIAE